MNHIKFNKDISFKVWDQSTFNTSKKPNLKTFFNKDFTIYSKFKIEKSEGNTSEVLGVFAKSGLHSGVFVNIENDLHAITAQLWTKKMVDAENINLTFMYDFTKEWNEIFYTIDYTNKIFRATCNGVTKEAPILSDVVSYENTPLCIGAAAPHYIEQHLHQYSWWFKGMIDDVIIMEKALSKEEIDLFNADIIRRFTLAKYKFTLENLSRFKIWDGSGNGNHALLYQDFNVNDIQNKILDKIKGL
jgi:hypothetical protein